MSHEWTTTKPEYSEEEGDYWTWDGTEVRLLRIHIKCKDDYWLVASGYDVFDKDLSYFTHFWGPLEKPEPPL